MQCDNEMIINIIVINDYHVMCAVAIMGVSE